MSLMNVPGVIEKVAEALWLLGVRSVDDLKDRDAVEMYERLRNMPGSYAEPCLLNGLRVAVHFASRRGKE